MLTVPSLYHRAKSGKELCPYTTFRPGAMPTCPIQAPSVSSGRYAMRPTLTVFLQLNGPRPKLAFTTTVHARNQPNVHLNTRQTFIYASSPSNPNSASLIANITQHEAHGTLVLDLGKPIDSSSNGSPSPPNFSAPWSKFEKLVIAHAVLCGVGFLVFLPIGALLARYARTLTTGWFAGHWIGQFALGELFCIHHGHTDV